MLAVLTHESVDRNNPRSLLEASEEEPEPSHNDLAFAFGRVLAWLLDAKTLNGVGFRAYIFAHKIRPDLIKGMTLDEIASILGHGRSSSHKLSKELEMVFGIRGLNDRSDAARKKYRESWKRVHSPS